METNPDKNPAAQAMARLRWLDLTKEQRAEIARKAAHKGWATRRNRRPKKDNRTP